MANVSGLLRMGTQQVGNKLVRLFGQGDKTRRVVSEVIEGKTITHVTDMAGKPVLSRMKSVSTQQIGNKTVRTIDSFLTRDGDSFYRNTTDKVYKDGNYLGKRNVYSNECYKFVTKNKAGDEYREKTIFRNKAHARYYKSYSDDNLIIYNDRGLPIPKGAKINDYTGMSLREMKNKFYTENPNNLYAPEGIGLDFLNKLDGKDTLEPIKDQFSHLVEKFKNLS